ncbi:HAD family phosphatase [Rhodovastum atsumiense]|uniref:HAD family phosphatase n=1 Tax=Rhodovastum atsumiense TaxID=504468 RepID=A0A5M6IZJ7_9PROT|nr:HAD family phosphatase [Rhodovastum atsumiense]KAA5613723.1 HAD family phosphatase [Rhodovastum atsumiense]CAH2599647.1 HAD family phosphatase [Rhodovastum atsumiense]
MAPRRPVVVFDLGGVLIDWNPRHLYRKLFAGDEAGMERFLAQVCSPAWNLTLDAGRDWAEAIAELVAQHPEQAALITAYHQRWPEMLGGPIAGSVAILDELRQSGTPLYALTNWSDETFAIALRLYDFLGWFEGIVVSGRERLVKPDPRLFRILLDRHGLAAGDVVYIDDNPANAEAAGRLGMHPIHFTTAPALRANLGELGLLAGH